MVRTLIYVLVLLGASACGGGGGNAGTCFGSAQVCGIAEPAVLATYPAVDNATITCPQILALFNNDKKAAYAAAQYYLSQGATRLNGDPESDKTACDNYNK